MSGAEANLVPGRSCDACAICCKLFDVPQVESPGGEWCRHCEGHLRCGIHPTRPQACRDFFCFYLRDPVVPDHWQPNRSHMVIVMDSQGTRTLVYVDPVHADIWRAEPYHGDLKQWARQLVPNGRQLHVRVGARTIAILPDRDEDLGEVGERLILWRRIDTPAGPSLAFELIAPDDPRAAALPFTPPHPPDAT